MSDALERLAARTFGARRRIYLMRHGSSSYFDTAGRPVGTDMAPLNELGRAQSKAAGDLLRDVAFDRVIVSGLPRTIETAELVLQHNRQRAPAYETWPELREIRGARVQDIRAEDVEEGFLGVFGRPSNFDARFLGGESVREFVERVWPAFARLLADPAWREALLVLHGGTNRAILSYCLAGGADGRCAAFLPALHQTPACINLIDVGDAPGDFVVRAVNLAALDLLQTKTRKTTLEELLEKFLRFRKGH
ncbi:MAG: histidine phosphatase family protein [Burkholderiales bacterium]|nr:histidine phosphatase family protein [Burkholderiales bacterium]